MIKAFKKLVDAYSDRIYTFAYHSLHSREAAEDVTQEVLMRIWQQRSQLEEDRMLPWIMRVTRNATIDAHRRRASYRRYVTPDHNDYHSTMAASLQPDPCQETVRSDFRRHLEEGIQKLKEPQRSIVILREIQGLKYHEIAAILELPLNTVKVYLRRARLSLRKHMQEVLGNELCE